MVNGSSPPFVWPATSDPRQRRGNVPAWVNIPVRDLDVAITGIVWSLDRNGVRSLHQQLCDLDRIRIKLVVAVYAASPTTCEILRELLDLIEVAEGRLSAALLPISLESNASPMSVLCFSESKRGSSHLWVGNSGNLGYGAGEGGHLNFGFECEAVLASQWLNWFAGAWIESAPLTPLTANVPALVAAPGTKDAANRWREYEELCRQLGSPEKIVDDMATPNVEARDQEEEVNKRQQAIAHIRTEMRIPVPDQLQERIARLMAKGQVVTIDQNSRTPPLELPLSKYLRLQEFRTERIFVKSSAGLRIFDEKESKELERLRRGLADLINRLTYPLAEGVRWIPIASQPLLARERARLDEEAKGRLGALVKGDVAGFVKSRRSQIESEANEVYAKFNPNERLPPGTVNLLLRDLEDRLVKATGENFLPKVSYATQRFSVGADSQHVAQWAPARTLLGAVAEYARKAVNETGHLRGYEIPEEDLLPAMNVCDDHILRARRDSNLRNVAKRELGLLEGILTGESDDRTKCEKILELIKGPQKP